MNLPDLVDGPELISITLADWAEQHSVALEFIKPGKPIQNGFIERFNRSYREAVLDMYVFQSLHESESRLRSGSRSTTRSDHTSLWVT